MPTPDLFEDPPEFVGDEPPPKKQGRPGGFTLPEHLAGNSDLREMIALFGDDDAKRKAMAMALYRLGAVALDRVGQKLLDELEGQI